MITEERLAALEAQMAALVEPPTEYYTSRYSGEEIDKGIDGALQLGGASTPQGAIAALGAGVRPNLLVNPFFKINQRGKTRYTGFVPTVDCWKSNSATLTVQVTDDGVLLSGTGFDYLKNYIESPEQYNGKTITVSALVKNPGGQFRINLYNESKQVFNNFNIPASSDWVIISGTIHGVQVSDGDRLAFLLYPGGGVSGQTATAQVMATKVEEGETQTLGYIDSSGNPVLLERPDPLELLKCQRYFYYAQNILCPGQIKNGNIYLAMYLPTKMRVIPSMTVKSYGTIINNGVSNVPTTFDSLLLSGNILHFRTNAPANTANYTPCVLTDLNAEISAEL